MKVRNKTALIIAFVIIIMLIITGITYAYFSANLTGEEETTTITVTGGTMNIVYNSGANINIIDIIPSDNPAAIKTFTVTGNNTTDIPMRYKVSLVVEENTFSEEALKYKLISTNTDNNGQIVPSITEQTNIGTGSKIIELGTGTFDVPTGGNKTHTYNLEIYFPNQDYNQNEDQNKEIKAHIKIENNTDPCAGGACLGDKILAQGGGEAVIESKGNPDFTRIEPRIIDYQEVTEIFTSQLTSSSNRTVGSGYTFIETTGRYNLTNYVTGVSYGEEYIGYYTCGSTSYNGCSTIYKINAISDTNVTNSIKYTSKVKNYSSISTGLYAAEDDYGTSYYYRGNKDLLNNNLLFAGFQWKITRINGDGSIRIIYNGTEEDFNTNNTVNSLGSNTQIKTAVWTTHYGDFKYFGYMYGGANGEESTQRHGTISVAATYNETSSNAKVELDNWYQENISGKSFESKVVDNTFCNDRQFASEVGGTGEGKGYGKIDINMNSAAYYRVNSKKKPTFQCPVQNDRFTTNDISIGNGDLTYPVGLISADEIGMAGIVHTSYGDGVGNYLYTNQYFWTSSPCFTSSSGSMYLYAMYSSGAHTCSGPGNVYGLRPVLNLSSNVTVTGDGTATNPYRVI